MPTDSNGSTEASTDCGPPVATLTFLPTAGLHTLFTHKVSRLFGKPSGAFGNALQISFSIPVKTRPKISPLLLSSHTFALLAQFQFSQAGAELISRGSTCEGSGPEIIVN